MNNEETRLFNEETRIEKEKTHFINEDSVNNLSSVPSADNTNKSSKGKTAAAVAGGFVAGAAAGAATGAMASNTHEEIATDEQEVHETPEPEDVILANNEGIRFAHVEADSFEDAFAQAREQVGPGGAFEYDGKIYGTYYADEWSNMSNQERADFQSRVNDVAPAHNSAHTPSASSHNVAESHLHVDVHDNHAPEPTMAHNEELVSEEPINNEVHILSVEAVQNENGDIMNVALLESGGDLELMVDVDNNGYMDIRIHDDNQNGWIEDHEIHEIPGQGPHVIDLLTAQAAQQGDFLSASDDNMPDYINDADAVMEI